MIIGYYGRNFVSLSRGGMCSFVSVVSKGEGDKVTLLKRTFDGPCRAGLPLNQNLKEIDIIIALKFPITCVLRVFSNFYINTYIYQIVIVISTHNI